MLMFVHMHPRAQRKMLSIPSCSKRASQEPASVRMLMAQSTPLLTCAGAAMLRGFGTRVACSYTRSLTQAFTHAAVSLTPYSVLCSLPPEFWVE